MNLFVDKYFGMYPSLNPMQIESENINIFISFIMIFLI